jgi:uncharacterized protein YoxC
VEVTLNQIIQILQALALLALGAGMIMAALRFQRIQRHMDALERMLVELGRDSRPLLDRARVIAENVNYIVMSMRKEVDRVSDTISHANDRLEEALDVADERVQELGALLALVQGEVEDTVLSATSALRGIRTGARVLRGGSPRNDDAERKVEQAEE